MKATCSKSDLVKGIQTVQNVVSTKTTLPILSQILIETKGKDQLHLVATNLEIGIETWVPAKVLKEGGISVPARKMGDVIRELPEAEVSLTVEDNFITVECQKGTFKIAGLGRDDFPKIPQLEEKKSFSLRQDVLKSMIKRTSFAVSHDETRYALNGILFALKENKLRLIATDGRRLAYIEKKVDIPKSIQEEVIIPNKTSNEIFRILDEEKGDLKVIIGENQIAFLLDNIKLISRIIDGHFPDYRKVFPKKSKEVVTLAKEPFLQALKRVSILTSDKSSSVRLDISKERVLLTTAASEIGEAREELDLDYKGEEISIAFNPVYILDFLKNEESEKVCLELTDSLNPGLMRPVLPDDEQAGGEKYLYVIMPMKL